MVSKDAEQDRRGAVLLTIARAHLEETLRQQLAKDNDDCWRTEPWLFEDGAVFITLRTHGSAEIHGDLRGCVGSLVANRPLIDDIRDNTIAAAKRDPRFPPLEVDELELVDLEVTLLSKLEPMTVANEAEALAQLRPGHDGIVLKHGKRRATFLPQVWDSLPTPEGFLGELKRKAGLSPDFWRHDIQLERYGARKWREADLLGKPS